MKKVLVGIITAVIVVVAVVVGYNAFFVEDTQIGIIDDGSFYGMSVSELTNKKGLTEKRIRDDDKNISMYDYTEDLYGVEASFTYTFEKDFFGSYLCGVEVKAEIKDESQAAKVFDAVCQSLSDAYTEGEAKFNQAIDAKGAGSFSTTKGAYNPEATVSLSDGILIISCKGER